MANIEKANKNRIRGIEVRKELRQQRRKENKCIHCGCEVKPIIVYPQACEKHQYHKK